MPWQQYHTKKFQLTRHILPVILHVGSILRGTKSLIGFDMIKPRKEKLAKRIKWLVEDLQVYQPEKIILFGSAVRGDSDEYSDLDVVVIKKTSQRFIKRLVEVAGLLRDQVHPADVFVYTPQEFKRMQEEENSFIEQVLKTGKIIYEAPKSKR